MRALLLALASLAIAASAHAQTPAPANVLDAVLARGTLRVGMTGDYRPFSLADKAANTTEGLDVDLAGGMARALGVKLEIVPTTWSTLMADLAAQKFDVGAGGISVTLERQKTAFFSLPLMRTGKTPIARCGVAAKFQTLADIDKPGVKVITNPGGTNERFDRANLRAAEIVVFPSNAAIFDELVAGHADVMITDSVETRLQQKLHPELCAIHPDSPFDFGELALLLPRDSVWKAWVDQFVHLSMETGEYHRIEGRYLN